jgi:hypothetical protein
MTRSSTIGKTYQSMPAPSETVLKNLNPYHWAAQWLRVRFARMGETEEREPEPCRSGVDLGKV